MNVRRQEWATGVPALRLRPFVERYVGYRLAGWPAGLHRGLPSRLMTFIVSIGEGINVVAQTDPAQAPQRYATVLSGLQASAALIAHDGAQEGVAIELTPLGSRVLFGMPAGALWDTSVELSDVAGVAGTELWERVHLATGWTERFAACDTVLSRLAGEALVVPALRHCWAALVRSAGRMPVGDLAAETGYSRQHLTRLFREEFGLGPKLASRVIRFERARRMLERPGQQMSIGQVAVACGYYDQAHLVRDCADLAGCTPTELAAGDVPFVQD